MVQKRGRARAEKANYIVIAEATSTSKVREETNLIHEAMMLQAVQEVQNMQVCKREEYDMKVSCIFVIRIVRVLLLLNILRASSNTWNRL